MYMYIYIYIYVYVYVYVYIYIYYNLSSKLKGKAGNLESAKGVFRPLRCVIWGKNLTLSVLPVTQISVSLIWAEFGD